MKNRFLLFYIILLACAVTRAQQTITAENMLRQRINVHLDQKGAGISPSMYGIFFEEINRSGDGGLYAELVQNRSFEDTRLYPGWQVKKGKLYARPVEHHFTHEVERRPFAWPKTDIPGWSVKGPDRAASDKCPSGKAAFDICLTQERPRYSSAPSSLKLTVNSTGAPVSLVNTGFRGMAIKKGESYSLRIIVRTSRGYIGAMGVRLLSSAGCVIADTTIRLAGDDRWHDITTSLRAAATDSRAQLSLDFDAKGVVWLDYVSLFPKATFHNRPNGLRKDLAETLEALRPAFVRWPGGSIVGGITLDNRFDWKKTLGDPAARPGEYITWGYRCSYGMGYGEMLQFCEDLGADAMYVCNAGLSDMFRSGEACLEDSIQYFINDCLDAVEYAIGDTSTTWGARRAADGHPAPFPLKYVEIGNEHWGREYDRRVNMFYAAIKKRYPQLTLISDHPLWGPETAVKTDMVDPHWYGTPEFFFRSSTLFDSIPRDRYGVYVGEWACNFGVGKGNMRAALAEAAFIGNMERHGDLVRMSSFAPLLQNRYKKDWSVNLIWFDTDSVVCRSSYYVQQIAALNRPSYNVKNDYTGGPRRLQNGKGKVGFGSSKTALEIKDVRITQGGKTVSPDLSKGDSRRGAWKYGQGMLRQTSASGSSLYVLKDLESNDFTIELKARKMSAKEGIFLYYGLTSGQQRGFFYNIGGWNSGSISVEQLSDGHNVGAVGKAVLADIRPGRWYDLKLVVRPEGSTLYVDGKRVLSHTPMSMPRQFVASGIDEDRHELVLKVVNRDSVVYHPEIRIDGAAGVEAAGETFTLSARSDTEENSFGNPDLIQPQHASFNGFGKHFTYKFKPFSYTVLRIKLRK